MIPVEELGAMLVARAAAADKIAELSELRDSIDARIRDELPVGTTRAAGFTVQVQATHRLNTGRLALAFPPDDHPGLYRPQIDTTAVRHAFAPAELEPFTDESRRVVIR